MRVLITAGTWDLNNGKTSSLIHKMYELLKNYKDFEIDYYNGGNYNDLKLLVEKAKDYEIIFWMANVPNELEKVRDVKNINPFAIVIGSKRNHYDYEKEKQEYTFVEVLNKALIQRNNLTIEFSKLKNETKFKMLLFDPLGSSWYEGYDIEKLVENMVNRINFIKNTKRERTYEVRNNESKFFSVPDNKEFFNYVREVAEIFHKTIQHADGVTRFLGNASFRQDKKVYVSRRDVDKAFIDKENFVYAFLKDNTVCYYGKNKPSKDTVVQIRLYEQFKNINYIVHSHCYVKKAPFTEFSVPCGALDEIDEIKKVIKNKFDNNYDLNYYAINLKGHGCLLFSSSIEELQKTIFETRNLPERMF